MKASELRTLLSNLQSESDRATKVAGTAERNKKPLGGDGPYAHRFHAAVLAITSSELKIRKHLGSLGLLPDELKTFDTSLVVIKEPAFRGKNRIEALRKLRLVCDTVIGPIAEAMIASSVPSTEQIIPLAVVRDTRRTFLVKIVTQINGCYEHQWYDACSVMIRKMAEILIIAVYEHKNESPEIKGNDGNFYMLSDLIRQIKAKTGWNLGRGTKSCLDKMKELGDSAAHVRHYVATKEDVDKLLAMGLRVAVEDLIYLAGLKAIPE